MDDLTLVRIHNAFDRSERDTLNLKSGLTLGEIRALHLPAAVEFTLSINGRTSTDMGVIPTAGDLITAVPVVSGGNDGKMIGRIIAMIVVAVVAAYAGPALSAAYFGGSSVAASVISGAIMIVGGLVVNMAFAPNQPNLPTYGNGTAESPSYGWAPQSTQQQGIVIPRWYGRVKLYGNIIGAHILYSGNDSYINSLVHLGFGPYRGLSDFRINDQPIENFTGVQTPDVRLGYLDQPVVTDFTDTVVEYPTSQLATFGDPVIYTTQGDNFDALEITIRFPEGLGEYSMKFNMLIGLHVQYALYISPAGTDQWISLSLAAMATETLTGWKIGKWVQVGADRVWAMVDVGNIPSFAHWYYLNSEEYSDLYLLQSGMPFIAPVAAPDVTMIYSEDQGQYYELDASKLYGLVGYSWQLFSGESVKISYTDGFSENPYAFAQQRNPYTITRTVSVPVKGRWDIKLERLSVDFTEENRFHKMFLSGVAEITRQTFTYPRQVLVGLKALATNQLSGSLRFSCIGECALVRVWDGSVWAVQYSTNPAWICYDILTQPVFANDLSVIRYDGIDPSRVKHAKFLEWANYCDELLPDGHGGQEKRIEFNGGFDSEMSLWEAALRICSVSYATLIWNGVHITVAIDKPATPVQLFSLGNIDQDSFRETFLPMADRASEIEADYINQENQYQRDKLTVINAAMTTVTSKVSMSMFGITKPSMVWRACKRKLAYNQHTSRAIEFGADIDAVACTVGDVVLVQHDVPQWGYGGRVVSGTATQVTIDQIITLQPGLQYAILVRLGDDTLVERTITNAPGDSSVLTVSTPFPSAPQPFDVFSVGEVNKIAKPFRISDISRTGELRVRISGVEYVPGIYDVDYDLPVVPGINYSQPLTSYKQSLPPFETITGLTAIESLRKYAGGGVDTIITLYWQPAINRFAFPTVDIWAWLDGAPPVKISNTPISTDTYEWIAPIDGVYWNFVVALINLNGESQKVSALTPLRVYITGKTGDPANVTAFHATPVITGGLRFSWSAVPDVDLSVYIGRYSPLTTGASWYGATEVFRTPALYANLNIALPGTYFIKALDTTDHYSQSAASIVVSSVLSQIAMTNHATINMHPDWLGGFLNAYVQSGELWIANTQGLPPDGIPPLDINGYYDWDGSVDFGEVRTARLLAKCDWYVNSDVDFWLVEDVFNSTTFYGETGQSWVTPVVMLSMDGINWLPEQPLFAGDFTFKAAMFGIRAYMRRPDDVRIRTCTVSVDLHDTVITI